MVVVGEEPDTVLQPTDGIVHHDAVEVEATDVGELKEDGGCTNSHERTAWAPKVSELTRRMAKSRGLARFSALRSCSFLCSATGVGPHSVNIPWVGPTTTDSSPHPNSKTRICYRSQGRPWAAGTSTATPADRGALPA
jgi:hypothetical protein